MLINQLILLNSVLFIFLFCEIYVMMLVIMMM